MAEIKFGTIEDIKPGTIVRHFKGNYYYIESIVMDSENITTPSKDMVIYRALYRKQWRRQSQIQASEINGYALFSRPFDMFTEEVDRPEFNYSGMRFSPVVLPSSIAKSIANVITRHEYEWAESNLSDKPLDKLIVLLQTLYTTISDADIHIKDEAPGIISGLVEMALNSTDK